MATIVCGFKAVVRCLTRNIAPWRHGFQQVRCFSVSAETIDDEFSLDPNYTVFDPPESFAVFNSASKWFEPTVPFNDVGRLIIPNQLDQTFAKQITDIAAPLGQIQQGVVRLMVTFDDGYGTKNHLITTGFAVSPKVLFTDYHCVPPVTYVYDSNGRRAPVRRMSISALSHPTACKEQSFTAPNTPIPLEIVQLHNDRSINVPTVDPITGQSWPKGVQGVDLAVLKISDDCTQSFSSFFYPSTSPFVEGMALGYIGYPRLLSSMHLNRVMAVIKASGFTFSPFDGIDDRDQNAAAIQVVEAALRQCFASYDSKVLALGKVKKIGLHELAVTHPSTTGTSGSPYISLDDPSLVLGNHLGNGVTISRRTLEDTPNYNLIMTVDHPEWVIKYAKYAVPSLPSTADTKKVHAYLTKHAKLLK